MSDADPEARSEAETGSAEEERVTAELARRLRAWRARYEVGDGRRQHAMRALPSWPPPSSFAEFGPVEQQLILLRQDQERTNHLLSEILNVIKGPHRIEIVEG